jgi:hypothetical protein
MDIKRHKARIYIVSLLVLVFAALVDVSTWGQQGKSWVQNKDRLNALLEAVKSRRIQYKFTKIDEIKALLGEPQKEEEKDLGERMALCMSYPNIEVWFRRHKEDRDGSFKLQFLSIKGKEVDIGGLLQGQRQIIVRNIDDLHEIGLKNINLKNLDLSGEGDYLKGEDFDSLTQWPGPEKLPTGFDPKKLLEEGKNPGLGIRALHEEGINGEGVGIAIMDQPLLLGHEEYSSSRLIRYDATRATWLTPRGGWMPPQMHGPPVVGIAVGKTCGVAPGAFVFYYAGRTTVVHEDQADWINEIIKYNETAEKSDRIRVISISANPGQAENNDAFLKARKRARDAGILVLTTRFPHYGSLTLIEGKDPDKPESYKGGRSEFGIPTRNKTIASDRGINTYLYSRGLAESWAPPYIAGLAALALQVNPDLQPETILEQLVKTATHTKAGPVVVNPHGFIESVKRSK